MAENYTMAAGCPEINRIDAVAGEPIIDLNYALQQVAEKLPGWCWRIGTCCVSDDAWLAPDHNDPVHGLRLKAELGPIKFNSVFDRGVDIDRRPPGNVGQALLDAMNLALEAIEEERAKVSTPLAYLETPSHEAHPVSATSNQVLA